MGLIQRDQPAPDGAVRRHAALHGRAGSSRNVMPRSST